MAGRKQTPTGISPEKQRQLEDLRYAVKRCEDKGLTDTAHHEMLKRLESELGLIPGKKDLRDQTDEVNNGESNL